VRQNKSGQYKENAGRAATELEYVSSRHCLCCRVINQRVVNDQIASQEEPQDAQTPNHSLHSLFLCLTKNLEFFCIFFHFYSIDILE
jgi:hypothetical protein